MGILPVFGSAVAVVGERDVVDLLIRPAPFVDEALDDLDAVEIAALGILERPDGKGRRLGCGFFFGRSLPMGTPSL